MVDLGIKCLMVKLVLKLLSQEQKEFCASVVKDLLQTTNDDPNFLEDVLTDNEL